MKLGYQKQVPDSASDYSLPLVLLHAFPLNSEMWRPQLQYFGRTRLVIAPDFRGYGKSDEHDGNEWDVSTYAGDVRDTLQELKITRAVIGGCSMGGYTIFELFRQEPGLFAGMILADTRAEPDTDDGKQKRHQQIQKIQQQGTGFVPDFVVENLLGNYTRRNRPEVVEHVKSIVSNASAGTITSTLRMLATRPDSGPTLPTINIPCLVVVGEEDTVTPRENSERLVRDIPGSQLEIIPNAGHLSPLENPEGFNKAVERFLTAVR